MSSTPMEIWAADTEALGLEGSLDRLLSHLPGEDREKALRFLKREDRVRCAAGRLMIHALARKRLGRADVPLRLSEYGKPYFACDGAPQFSLSHAGRLVVLASAEFPVGVDVERRVPVNWRELAFVFSEKERASLEASGDPQACFYRFWTVREAFAKEEGLGLSIFDSGAFEMDYTRKTVVYGDQTLRFETWEFDDYTLSLCAASVQNAEVRHLSAADWKHVLAANGCTHLSGQGDEI